MRIFLHFVSEQTSAQRSRLAYAFRLFCAIYGHQPLSGIQTAKSADVWISYSDNGANLNFPKVVRLSNSYLARPLHEPAPPPVRFDFEGEKTILFNKPVASAHPDWLGEIFEWVSCADEYAIRKRDSHDRVNFEDSYMGRNKLDVQIPYAAIAMRFLQLTISRVVPQGNTGPVCPIPSLAHCIVNTHDVDFIPVSNLNSLRRLAKNAAISLILRKNPKLALSQGKKALLIPFWGSNPLDQLSFLADREKERCIDGSYFVLARRGHRRDGNYDLNQKAVLNQLQDLEDIGMEIGVHGSYTSLDEPYGLASEFDSLRAHGFAPKGGRQHYLRFTLDRLIPAVEKAEALYDTSLGWSDFMGFRAGACFPFPPYNFEFERAATFLEFPLILMEGTLLLKQNGNARDLYSAAARLLAVSRKSGWGGVSVLWHPSAFGEGQFCHEIGNLFWRLVDSRREWRDAWMSGRAFFESVRQRYVEAGLLKN